MILTCTRVNILIYNVRQKLRGRIKLKNSWLLNFNTKMIVGGANNKLDVPLTVAFISIFNFVFISWTYLPLCSLKPNQLLNQENKIIWVIIFHRKIIFFSYFIWIHLIFLNVFIFYILIFFNKISTLCTFIAQIEKYFVIDPWTWFR